MAVEPGDIVFGDDDGLIVVSATELSALISIAQEIQAKEEEILSRMESGVGLLEMLNFDEHWENVKSGKSSQLSFEL